MSRLWSSLVHRLTPYVPGEQPKSTDVVKLNIFLTDLGNFPTVNEIMAQYFQQPYPARAAIGVAALPKAVGVEMDAVLVID